MSKGIDKMASAWLGWVSALALGVFPAGLRAQDAWPAAPIKIIVPFPAGGIADVIPRLLAEEIGQVLGQRVVIENAGGAGGTIAAGRAARAAPDGYTLMAGNTSSHATAYFQYKNLTYSPDSFAAVGLIARTAPVLAIRNGFPAKTLAQFMAYARQSPATVSLGHGGVNSPGYVMCRSFLAAAGIDVNLVSYRGAGAVLNDLMAGHIDSACDSATSISPAILAGKVHALAAGASARLPNVPDLLTSAEAGLPGFQAETWEALFVPAGTPDAIIGKLNVALRAAVSSTIVQRRLFDFSSIPAKGEELEPAYTDRLVMREIEKYRKLLGE